MTFTLHIPKISLNLFIGYFPEERDSKKQIEIEIILKYKKLPQSCFTDSLEDKKSTICYKNIIESLNSFIKNKNYLTIEKWCYEISRFLIYEFELQNMCHYFYLKFTKIHIQLDKVINGVHFIYEKKF